MSVENKISTGSVREIAKREWDKANYSKSGLGESITVQNIMWRVWRDAYDSAAVNLPVLHSIVEEPVVSACDEIQELAIADWQENNYAPIRYKGQDKARHHRIFRQGYLAAKNLPVGNGWTDTAVCEIVVLAIQNTDSYPDTFKPDWWQDKIQEFINEYKLTHSPVLANYNITDWLGFAKWVGSNDRIYYSGVWILNDPQSPEDNEKSWTDAQMIAEYNEFAKVCLPVQDDPVEAMREWLNERQNVLQSKMLADSNDAYDAAMYRAHLEATTKFMRLFPTTDTKK